MINKELKEKIVTISFNQTQVVDCSHLLVFAAWDNYTKKDPNLLTADRKKASHGPLRMSFSEAPVFWQENSFEAPVFACYPRLLQYKEQLLQQGARVAVMSGSGSSLFGVFRTAAEAKAAVASWEAQGVAVFCHVL